MTAQAIDIWCLCSHQSSTEAASSAACARTRQSCRRAAAHCFQFNDSASRTQPARRGRSSPYGNFAHLQVTATGRCSQTSTHSADISSAMRKGLMRTALWVEPTAGTTTSKACSDRSQ
jgi:hypothetical protein